MMQRIAQWFIDRRQRALQQNCFREWHEIFEENKKHQQEEQRPTIPEGIILINWWIVADENWTEIAQMCWILAAWGDVSYLFWANSWLGMQFKSYKINCHWILGFSTYDMWRERKEREDERGRSKVEALWRNRRYSASALGRQQQNFEYAMPIGTFPLQMGPMLNGQQPKVVQRRIRLSWILRICATPEWGSIWRWETHKKQ